jgi:hypothetical protein
MEEAIVFSDFVVRIPLVPEHKNDWKAVCMDFAKKKI